nr:hypothetical protein [Tanacetum cinerariifolium]
MSRDVLTIGSTMRIPLLYRGEYSQWVERFMNYLEEQTDREAMINSIKNGKQPLPRVTQVSIAGTTSTELPPLKDKSMWSDQEKRVQKIDHFNRRKFYSKPTNNNLRTSSSSQSANKKQEFVKTDNKRVEKKDDEKKRDMSKSNAINEKRWDISPKTARKQSDSDQEINENMVFMAQIQKVLSDSEASSSSANEKISKVSYYLSESECESEYETSEYYDNSTNYGLFVNNDDDQEIFHDAIESASENFIENHIDSQKDYDKSDNRVDKANQQSKDFENQNKDLQDKYDVLKNQTTTFKINNNELNEQLKELIEKNNDLLAQTKVLKEQLQVKHVMIDTHVECHEKYAKLEAERYEYMIRYSTYFDNNKQHRKQIVDQQVLFDKMSVQ